MYVYTYVYLESEILMFSFKTFTYSHFGAIELFYTKNIHYLLYILYIYINLFIFFYFFYHLISTDSRINIWKNPQTTVQQHHKQQKLSNITTSTQHCDSNEKLKEWKITKKCKIHKLKEILAFAFSHYLKKISMYIFKCLIRTILSKLAFIFSCRIMIMCVKTVLRSRHTFLQY